MCKDNATGIQRMYWLGEATRQSHEGKGYTGKNLKLWGWENPEMLARSGGGSNVRATEM